MRTLVDPLLSKVLDINKFYDFERLLRDQHINIFEILFVYAACFIKNTSLKLYR